MRKSVGFLILCITAFPASGFASESLGGPSKEARKVEPINEFLERCLRDFERIKPGMTREEVERRFPKDGGLQSLSLVRFQHPECFYLKVDIEFEFKRDAKDQGRAIRDMKDKVIKVSRPYLDRPTYD